MEFEQKIQNFAFKVVISEYQSNNKINNLPAFGLFILEIFDFFGFFATKLPWAILVNGAVAAGVEICPWRTVWRGFPDLIELNISKIC